MGAQNQPVSNETHLLNQLQNVASKHPKFIQASIFKSQDQQIYFQVTQSIGNLTPYHSWEKKITQIKKTIGPNSLYLPSECSFKEQGLCGFSGTLKFKFDFFAFLLDQEIQNRQSQNQPFQEKQLWFLLYILIQTAAELHKSGFLVGDIHPKNIFINHAGDLAIYSIHSFPEDLSNFQKVVYFQQANYLPPQGVNDINTGKTNPTYDEKLGESFSIGLTILDAIFLTDHSFLYDKMQRFNEIVFMKILDALKNSQISVHLKNIIASLLSINPQKRLPCIQLHEFLLPYEKQIFQLEEFEIKNELPFKYISQVESSPTKSTVKDLSVSNTRDINKNISQSSTAKKISRGKFSGLSITKNNQGNQQQNLNNQSLVTSKLLPYEEKHQSYSNQASIESIRKFQNSLANSRNRIKTQQFEINKNNESINHHIIQKVHDFSRKNNDSPIKQVPKLQNQKNQNQQLSNQSQSYVKIPKTLEQTKTPSMVFKTGSLFQRQRSSNSIIIQKTQIITQKVSQQKLSQPRQLSNQDQFKAKDKVKGQVHLFELPKSSNNSYDDFLKNIDKQIQESRKLFPDSMK